MLTKALNLVDRYLPLLLLLALLGGCRSERVAFQFAPLSCAVVAFDSAATTAATSSIQFLPARPRHSLVAVFVPNTVLSTGKALTAPHPVRLTQAPLFQPPPKYTQQLKSLVSHRFKPAGSKRLADATARKMSYDGLLFLGGGVLAIAGIIIGLSIGGNAGLLVGAVLYLIGTLMIARGYMGKW